jgi:3'(2'), 5'-bisphosphate nucleotidase
MTVPEALQLDTFDRDVHRAVRMVRDAMRVARSLECRTSVSTKPDTSPVTVADFAIQAVVAEQLREAYPGEPLIGEEDAASLRASPHLSRRVVEVVRQIVPDATIEQVLAWIGDPGPGHSSRFWILDPIDGTKGFIHGRQYVIALALVVDGRVEMSAIGCPRLSLVFREEHPNVAGPSEHGGIAIAVRGHGAWWSAGGEDTFQRLAVSTCRDVSNARVVQSFEARHGDPERFVHALHALETIAPPLLMDSQAKHVTVAAGASDLLIRFPPHAEFHDAVWDQAAGTLLIEEAGGRVTDLAGQPLDFTSGRHLLRNTGMLASNGFLHAATLEAIGRAS